MKNARIYIVFVLLLAAITASARDFVKNEKIYVNTDQSHESLDWGTASAKVFLYFFGGSSGDEWISMSPVVTGSKIYVGTFSANRNHNKVIVVRKDPATPSADWSGTIWNQTCDLPIPEYKACNIINKFWKNSNCSDPYAEWKTYTLPTSTIPSAGNIKSSGVTEEVIHVCTDAAGDPFSLRVKLNSARTAYNYADVTGHGWFYSANGTSWTSVDSYAGNIRDEEKEQDMINNNFPSTLPSAFYYYLYSNLPAGRRLIKIVPDADCELDCTITSFETAISAVNADNNTYTLDGMVAFGKAEGNLIIKCGTNTKTINNPASPQSFSLEGLPASTIAETATVQAYFSGNTGCTKSITFNVPNAQAGVETKDIHILVGNSVTLSPVGADSKNDYLWLADGTTISGANQIYTTQVFTAATQVTYTYKEFYPISGTMDDMMANGDYEDKTFNYGKYGQTSRISDYNYWGIHQQTNANQEIHFYDTCSLRTPDGKLDNGFAVVRNANKFHSTFAKVKAHQKNNFALFDAATGTAGGNKKAWYATTANNPNLKLKKGTTYVLSFWAANINNYGEMDNAAQFKFHIQYNSNTWESSVLDLGSDEFRNNIWHQHSETFYAEEDCDNVTISVVNLNTNVLEIGNDFALDDIQFHAISSISKVVRSQQKFIVTVHEPKIDAFTATVLPVDCDGTSYKVRFDVTYQNPSGQLIIKDKMTGTEYSYDVPTDWAYDTQYNLSKTIDITTNESQYEWEAYFSDWTSAKKTATTNIPGFPAIEAKNFQFSEPGCTDLTTTLTFDLDYTYQQGNLTYWVDGLTAQTHTYSVANKTKQTLTGLTFAGIPADGKDNHVLHVKFDGANSCEKTYDLPAVPFSPVISEVAVSGVPAKVACSADQYTITVTVTTPYDATGHKIVLTYDDNGTQTKTVDATGTTTTTTITMHNVAGPAQTILASYETTACAKESDTFSPPTREDCNKYEETICEGESFVKYGFNIVTPPLGVDTFTLGNDSLILTVLATPAVAVSSHATVCDSEDQIRLPFTLEAGAPDSFVIRINNADYEATADGHELIFARPTNLQPGDYSSTITVGQKGIGCSTNVSVNIRIAAANLMYRKWEDVLFIDNSSKRFISYQWFDNGQEIAGGTDQYLYNPNGLPGTYCCQVTTTDGLTFFTCELPFEEVTRSRDESNKQTRQIIRQYRVSPHVYIIQEQVGDAIETRKVLTPHE